MRSGWLAARRGRVRVRIRTPVAVRRTVPPGSAGVPVSLASRAMAPSSARLGEASAARSAGARRVAVASRRGESWPDTSSTAWRNPTRSRSTPTASPKRTVAGASSRAVSPLAASWSDCSRTVLPGTSSVAPPSIWAGVPDTARAASVRMASAVCGPETSILAEPETPAASMPARLAEAATTGAPSGSRTRALMVARPTRLPGIPASRASASMRASFGSIATVASRAPASAWPTKGRRSASLPMRSWTRPSGILAPSGRRNAPSACRLRQSARSILASTVPSVVRLAVTASCSGASASRPCAWMVPLGADGTPLSFASTLTGPRGTPCAPMSPSTWPATVRLSAGPSRWPVAAMAPERVGATTARSVRRALRSPVSVPPARPPLSCTRIVLPARSNRLIERSCPRACMDRPSLALSPIRPGSGAIPPVMLSVPSPSSAAAPSCTVACRCIAVLPSMSTPPRAAKAARRGRAMSAVTSWFAAVRAWPSAENSVCASLKATGRAGSSSRAVASSVSGAPANRAGSGPGMRTPSATACTVTWPALPPRSAVSWPTAAPAASSAVELQPAGGVRLRPGPCHLRARLDFLARIRPAQESWRGRRPGPGGRGVRRSGQPSRSRAR